MRLLRKVAVKNYGGGDVPQARATLLSGSSSVLCPAFAQFNALGEEVSCGPCAAAVSFLIMSMPLSMRRLALVTAMALGPAAAVFAQAAPVPTINRSPPTWLGYVIVFVLITMVVAVSLMPSKRSHQD